MATLSFFENIEIFIKDIFYQANNRNISYDILDDKYSIEIKKLVLKDKQRRMKIGMVWQYTIGTYPGFENIDDKIDIISHKYKLLIEVKNRSNTDNRSSLLYNYQKLYEYKLKYPEYTCIYGCINCSDKRKTDIGDVRIIKYKDIKIYHYYGKKFLNLIFHEDTENIIMFLKDKIKKFS